MHTRQHKEPQNRSSCFSEAQEETCFAKAYSWSRRCLSDAGDQPNPEQDHSAAWSSAERTSGSV